MATRKSISKKTRFEVFKRDSFKCQFCGASAPEAILHIDHLTPVSKGGGNEILNLITSCFDCNSGKSDRELSDDSVVSKQRDQLEELNERRSQQKMMLQWRKSLARLKEDAVDAVCDAFENATNGHFHLNETGRKGIRALLRKYPLSGVLDAIEVAAERHFVFDSDGKPTAESAQIGLNKIKAILGYSTLPYEQQRLLYIRGILRNRLNYLDEHKAITLLKEANSIGVPVDELQEVAVRVSTWTEFREEMEEIING